MAEPTRPIVWMRALRDAQAASGGTLNVLLMLALRMRKDGTGWAPQKMLAADAGVSESTVRRALRYAMDVGWVERTRRGHRLSDDRALASEYRLTLPSQPSTYDLLGDSQPGTDDRLGPSSDGRDTSTQPVISEANRSNGQANRSPMTAQGVLSKGSINSSVPPFGGWPAGHRAETLDDLRAQHFTDPFQLGKAVAELCNSGEQVWPEQFQDLIRDHFDVGDEPKAYAGLNRYRVKQGQEQHVPW